MNEKKIYKYLIKYKNETYIEDKYLSFLYKNWYTNWIDNFKNNNSWMLLYKWEIFLENYKNRNIFDKFETLTKNYPNSIKIPLSFITWIIATVITIYIKILIN